MTMIQALRIDKLRKDLVFHVEIQYSGWISMFASLWPATSLQTHRETRRPLYSLLINSYSSLNSYFIIVLALFLILVRGTAHFKFTITSIHTCLTLSFIYTGTLILSHRSYDLISTAFAILRASLYLSRPSLQDEIQARIVQEILLSCLHTFWRIWTFDQWQMGYWRLSMSPMRSTSLTRSGIRYGSKCKKSTSRTWFSTRPRWTFRRRIGSSRIRFFISENTWKYT